MFFFFGGVVSLVGLLFTKLRKQVEYQTSPSMLWYPCHYERSVVEKLLQTQFYDYVEKVRTTDCQATLRRLLSVGPPIYLEDHHAMPLPDGETHICAVWFANDNIERSSKLDGAVEGTERDQLWTELKHFIVIDGKEPGDDEEEEKEKEETVVVDNDTDVSTITH
jgi:hypothetical protein